MKALTAITVSEEVLSKLMTMGAKFKRYAPDWTGPTKPESAIKDVLAVVEKASVSNGDGGSFVSHFGNKRWL